MPDECRGECQHADTRIGAVPQARLAEYRRRLIAEQKIEGDVNHWCVACGLTRQMLREEGEQT